MAFRQKDLPGTPDFDVKISPSALTFLLPDQSQAGQALKLWKIVKSFCGVLRS